MLGRYQMQALLDGMAPGDLAGMFDDRWEPAATELRVVSG